MAITETKTKYGQVHGVQKDGYTVFRGVPYAKPPVGEKRFCPPEEPACWEGVYKADHFGCVCPQTEHEPDSFYGKEFYLDPEFGMKQSEDCLYLNIWTPANTVDPALAPRVQAMLPFLSFTSCVYARLQPRIRI